MEERKCFACEGFRHIACSCRNVEEEGPALVLLNKFEVLKDRVIQKGKGGGGKVRKDRKEILREEKLKRELEVRQIKVKRKEKKEKTLREVVVKIGLKQEKEEEGVVIKALLDSEATELVMSEEFAKRYKFKRMKLERLVYVRNVDGILNYARPIVDTVEVEIFFKEHKERMSINVIGDQKQSIILDMPWLGYHNPEIDWKTEKIKMTRCLEECGKKWRVGKQMKPEWKKQEEKEKKEGMRRLIVEEEKTIAIIIAEKEDEEEDLIELRVTEEMVPQRFHKYLKVFEKKDSERILMRKA